MAPPTVLAALVFTVSVPATPFCFKRFLFKPELVLINPLMVIPPGPTRLTSPPRPGAVTVLLLLLPPTAIKEPEDVTEITPVGELQVS